MGDLRVVGLLDVCYLLFFGLILFMSACLWCFLSIALFSCLGFDFICLLIVVLVELVTRIVCDFAVLFVGCCSVC